MAPASQRTEHVVHEAFRALLPADAGDGIDTVPLAQLGVDSLSFFNTILMLEDELGISIPLTELDNQVTLRDLLATIE